MPKLGLIVPSSNTTMEPEFSKALQCSNISLHTTRIPLNSVTIKALEAMEKETETAAKLLKDADVDLVVFGCTSGSLFRGLGYDLVLAKQIAEAAGCRVVTTAGAVVDALKALEAHRLSLATPYINEVTVKEIDFLNQSGFEVVKTESLGIKENLEIGRLTPQDAAVLAKKANTPQAQAIFISCTNFRTFEAISLLEQQLAKPVVSSNSATLWATLGAMETKIQTNLGKLFSTDV
jgi:maleate isomerase